MPTNNVLIVGGAGYIGSHMLLLLRQVGCTPIVLDNLSKGHRDAVHDVELIEGEMGDKALLEQLFATHQIDAVMHFASLMEVGESMVKPELYYQNNVADFLILLNAMAKAGVKNIVYSSSAAVYGEPQAERIHEQHKLAPINPYGRSKRMAEEMLMDFAKAGKLNYAILRYFNAAGADPSGKAGERHSPESHLIPLLLQVAQGKKDLITINGSDYPTADGTCVRDYVHVSDLCNAHYLALKALQKGSTNLVLNLGTGTGYTVKQVITAVKRVTKCEIRQKVGSKRIGDPAILIADPTLAKETLKWQPRYTDLDTIILHAWQYQQKNPH